MELEKINEKITDLGSVLSHQLTLAPPKGKLLTYKQIKKFCKDLERDLPKNCVMIVRALNLVRDTTLYSFYGKPWETDEGYDEYLNGAVEEPEKFKVFYNFTISLKTQKKRLKEN